MIARCENGPRCPHCRQINPVVLLEETGARTVECINCEEQFSFWIEKLPFYCTDTKDPDRSTSSRAVE